MAQQQRVRVTRPFRHRYEEYGAGSVLDLDNALAQELRIGNKVEFVANDTKAQVVPILKKEKSIAPEVSRIAALETQIAGLTALVEKLVVAPTRAAERSRAARGEANA